MSGNIAIPLAGGYYCVSTHQGYEVVKSDRVVFRTDNIKEVYHYIDLKVYDKADVHINEDEMTE